MPPNPTTPLGQALAAIIAILIAALAEHAAEHPLLAPGLRATIRQLEHTVRRFDAMAADWQAGRIAPRTRRPRSPHPLHRPRTTPWPPSTPAPTRRGLIARSRAPPRPAMA